MRNLHLGLGLSVYSGNGRSAVPVDKQVLQSLVNALNDPAQYNPLDYSIESWAAVEAELILAQGVYDDPDATQQQVDDATMAILDAIDDLVPVDIGCAFPFSGDISAMVPGSYPNIISGTDSQTSTADITQLSFEGFSSSSLVSPIVVDWDADTIRWVEADDLVWGSLGISDIQTPFLQFGSLATFSPQGASLGNGPPDGFTVRAAHEGGGPITNPSQVPTITSKLSIGLTGDGRTFVNVDGVVEQLQYTNPLNTSAGVVLLVTTYHDGEEPAASMRVKTFADTFTQVYPEIPGITKQVDLCGNPVEIAPITCSVTFTGDIAVEAGGEPADINGQTISYTFESDDVFESVAASTTPSLSPISLMPLPESGNRVIHIIMNNDSGIFTQMLLVESELISAGMGWYPFDGDEYAFIGPDFELVPLHTNQCCVSVNSDGDITVINATTGDILKTWNAVYTDGVAFLADISNALSPLQPASIGTASITVNTDAANIPLRVGMGDIDNTYKDWCGNPLLEPAP